MKLKTSGIDKALTVAFFESLDRPCPDIEFDWDDFYDGVVLSMDEADQIIEMLQGLEDRVDVDYEREIVYTYRQALVERYEAALKKE